MKYRRLRLAATLAVTGLLTAYLIYKINITTTLHAIVHANLGYFAAAVAIMIGTVWPMAWRWQQLLSVRGIHERLSWLTRAYFVAYTAGQLLPTAVGGDAVRIYETSKRHTGRGGDVAGSVLLERALGGAATLTLAAVGFALAIGNYPIGPYLWIEGFFVVATFFLAVALFSRRARPLLAKTVPVLRFLRVERPIRAAYEGIHAYRDHPGLLFGVFTLTLVVQAIRVLETVLRDGAAALPRPARPVLDQRHCRPRVVLRQLPRQARGQPGRRLRDGLSLLRGDALPVAARRAAPGLAEHPWADHPRDGT